MADRYRVKFGQRYPKLHGQRNAVLLRVLVREKRSFCSEFIEYDTVYNSTRMHEGRVMTVKENFPLHGDRFIVLVFIGEKLIPFTTVRPYNDFRMKYYSGGMGKVFDLVY